ncbi:hypothetical protein O6H91_05G066500 [Diphasiastrum complanatum]|nr:hypothetical protein O6H91_05G066500 [Diphasiastrum complanatum]
MISSDVPTDVVVEAGGIHFALHKFPLVSRSGRIRKLVAEAREFDASYVKLSDIPGGAEAFEGVAKFCYGINFEITTANAACLRCAAHYLEMTEDYGEGNLIARTEAFVNEVVTESLANAAAVLHSCENLLPLAEDLDIVSKCIDAAAFKACREQKCSNFPPTDYNSSGRMEGKESYRQKGGNYQWWAEDLSILRIDLYQRVLTAMRSQGLKHESIGGALMHYADRYLRGLNRKHFGRDSLRLKLKVHDTTTAMEQEQQILVETIVSMLPREKNATSCSFLFGLLRTAYILDTTVACKSDLEQRLGMQLDQATLDDLLVPSLSYNGDALLDIEIIHRIVKNFLQQKEHEEPEESRIMYDSDGEGSPSQSALVKVAKLVDTYLAEIATDSNLKLSKFISLAELIPDHARVVDDALYRAIDIYLKSHPSLTELERKKICKLMDVQKLSQEAYSHAAQNERLPVQIVVQVLYFEQMRLRTAMAASFVDESIGPFSHRIQSGFSSGARSAAISPRDNYASIRRENRELKLEVARMRMRLTDLEKDHNCMKQDMEKSGSTNKLFHSFTKKLNKLNPFLWSTRDSSSVNKHPQTPDSRHCRRRRHSIS